MAEKPAKHNNLVAPGIQAAQQGISTGGARDHGGTRLLVIRDAPEGARTRIGTPWVPKER